MATASPRPSVAGPWAHLNTAQRFWIVFQATVVLGFAAKQCLTNYDQFRLLWQEPTGLRMSAIALVLLVLHSVGLVGGYWLINHLTRRDGSQPGVLGPILNLALSVALFLLLYLPALFVVVIGPAALSIQKNLLTS